LIETIHVEERRRLGSLFVELFDEARFIKLFSEFVVSYSIAPSNVKPKRAAGCSKRLSGEAPNFAYG
jgi:hypothetical protein